MTCVIFDFDGTLTDADKHAPAFHLATQELLASMIDRPLPNVLSEWERIGTLLRNGPAEAGWDVEGRIVCPAHADPYLVANSIVKAMLSASMPHAPAAEVSQRVLDIHRDAYRRVPPVFRADARDVLDEVVERVDQAFVITNSGTQIVSGLIDTLGVWYRDRIFVHGDAHKFLVTAPSQPCARFDSLAASLTLPGLQRPVWLHRGRYYDVLSNIWNRTGTGPEATFIVGDLFELDLAMPWALGAHVYLMARDSTLSHERNAASTFPRSASSTHLSDVLAHLADFAA